VPAVIFAIAILVSLTRMWGTMFELPVDRITKLLYRRSPFVEAIDTATYIHDHTSPSDRIAILGSEPEIFFYAQRRSATGYIYTYPLMENQKFAHQMQMEMIAEITRGRPKYIVRVTNAPSWLRRPDS